MKTLTTTVKKIIMTTNIIEKISRYNLFNYLLPGVVFVIFALYIFDFDVDKISNMNLVLTLFFAYFVGMVVSRLGSIIFEPLLRFIKFVKFAEYNDFLEAVKLDKKIDELSEENNVYRTYTALFATLLFLYIAKIAMAYFKFTNTQIEITILILLFVLFLFAYRKQTKYIKNRINKNLTK